MADLLPCPFCGSHNVAQGASSERISVWCFCGARGPDVAFPQDCIDPVTPIKECHAAWNRRVSPSQVAPANPAQVTGSMKRDFAKWLEEQPGAVSMYQAYRAGRIAAMGAGGQAVAVKPLEWFLFEDDWWSADSIIGGYEVRQGKASARIRFPSKSRFEEFAGTVDEAKAAAQADYEQRILSALSQPHPADERVVEALPRPDGVSMTCGTICLEYLDRNERDLAYDWLEAHGAGAAKEGQ